MADYEIPTPEPKPIDEKNWFKLKDLLERATLKGKPNADEKCLNCLYYLNPDDSVSYCWHQQLRILVGGEWWCQWWEALPQDS